MFKSIVANVTGGALIIYLTL